MKAVFLAGLGILTLAFAGCATAPAPRLAIPAPGNPASGPAESLTYHVFMGELAWQRGERRIAVQQYAQAARLSSNPKLAEHAAVMAFRSGDDALALSLSRHWLELDPKNTDARQLEAVLDTRLGNTAAATREFEALLHDLPGYNLLLVGDLLGKEAGAQSSLPVMQKLVAAQAQSADAHFALARLALQAGQPQLAVSEAQRSVALTPDWNQAVVLEAQALVAAGQPHAAAQLLQARVKAAPADTDLHLAYAGLLAQTGQDNAARDEFNAVLKQHPRNADALYALGLLALQANQWEPARAYFMRLLATGKRKNDAFFFLGDTAEEAGQYLTALQWYQRVDGGQYWLPAQIATARVLLQQHKSAEARGYIDKLVADDTDDAVQLRLAEAQLFSGSGDDPTALAIFDQALAENPGNTDLLYSRALLRENLGQVAQAEDDLRLILNRQPDNADALNALGYTLTVYSTQYQEARTYIEKALQLKPGDPAIMDSMGWVEYRLGNYPQALGYLRKAYTQLADPDVAAHLSATLLAVGDKQEARAVWDSALKQHPDNRALLKLRPRFTR
ncbi:MAG: tetratricopeptide repeat protein [Gammaproteobacteria bacterium]|nr:tetratricopeptide repeat protein [Gammaproteobacteria bacterium]MBU6509269.1 tetratricopeptide repeat protein [Gammaproteobacteria bacterium]MDE1983210.1 tetratricopeptide repeat protein [Gammaproteobacteria bacterium]MDE2107723.1 tetratricopeptide repeat protein [Gammaproteobacteria bacterium]MDE2461349.1 tetratricopeptide repeat protein [Gammaproteobacteria bacterium]